MSTAGAKKKKPKRQARPGGAPLKAAPRRKKAAPRSKKPTAPKAKKAPKAKAPCKYGPRLANGRCPLKPRGSKNRLTVTARSVTGASREATDVVLNPKATRAQKIDAVEKVATATATETIKRTARKIATPSRLAKAKEIAVQVLKKSPIIGSAISAAEIIRRADPYARIRANEEIAKTKKALKQPLSKKDEDTLRAQYIQWFTTHRETPIGGK